MPSREQSGESDRHGSITKTGSKYARRILVEAAWHYTCPPRIGATLASRHDGQPDHILQIAWRAQHRLHRIHKRMRERKKPANVINTACALRSRQTTRKAACLAVVVHHGAQALELLRRWVLRL